MKYISLISSVLIVSILIIATIYYQNREPLLSPEAEWEYQQQQSVTEIPEAEPLRGIYVNDQIGYSLQNDKLQITYDGGNEWEEVPVEKEYLFAGEYNGNQDELIEDSFLLTEQYATFLFDAETTRLIYSTDQGATWQESVITESKPAIRYRKVEFQSDTFWYAILSFDRTMSQEGAAVYISADQGNTWQPTNMPDTTRLVADGGFVDADTGFIAYGTINPEEPDMYVTNDGGESWQETTFEMPSKYDRVFVMPNAPYKEEDHLALIMEQGPNGDYYRDGLIRAKFISNDNGHTWEFVEEVEPEHEEQMG
ncbi:oxidoreductase [Gracilibacillus caseinilyticus]|uniref:Oxidoreductase n=1 Tax=Gracilibacillus caseinilyticus TaxID=2932256 RepID=A0ABY4EX38_9BACI|nr:oxidoreductase [Gracilibacillus caseinilyticus]UOQ48981.1 oxidoreductase [Gracilibacillus caseinilyticus]